MPSKARAPRLLRSHDVDCYTKWLQLRQDPAYRRASDEIRQLARTVWDAWQVGRVQAEKVLKELEAKEKDICRQFDLISWAHPDDPAITVENADAVIRPRFPVYAIGPLRKVVKDSRTLGTRATEDGWLTVKVNLFEPLPQTLKMVKGILQAHRRAFDASKTRHRPDSAVKALEAWVCYQAQPNFVTVGEQLKRNVSTVKGQYVRGFALIHGQRPAGSIKQRRVGIVMDPAGEFQTHYASCSRCQKANTAEEFCPRWAAYVNQETKALRERIR